MKETSVRYFVVVGDVEYDADITFEYEGDYHPATTSIYTATCPDDCNNTVSIENINILKIEVEEYQEDGDVVVKEISEGDITNIDSVKEYLQEHASGLIEEEHYESFDEDFEQDWD